MRLILSAHWRVVAGLLDVVNPDDDVVIRPANTPGVASVEIALPTLTGLAGQTGILGDWASEALEHEDEARKVELVFESSAEAQRFRRDVEASRDVWALDTSRPGENPSCLDAYKQYIVSVSP